MAVVLQKPNAAEQTVSAAKKEITPTKVTHRNKFRDFTLKKAHVAIDMGFFCLNLKYQ